MSTSDDRTAKPTCDGLTRELLALANDIRSRDAAAIATRVNVLIHLGATRGDIEEALGVAVMKGGRRTMRYAMDALAAFDERASPAAALSSTTEKL